MNMDAKIEGLLKTKFSLAEHTSWKVGGEAEFFTQPSSLEELKLAFEWAHQNAITVHILGFGTNVLISDMGLTGLVIHMKYLDQYSECSDETHMKIKSQSGVPKSRIMKFFADHKLPPAVFLSGLPGDMGGGVVMNAGVGEKIKPREFCEIVESIKVLKWDSESKKTYEQSYSFEEIKWSYRKSENWQPGVVTEVTVSWPRDSADSSVLKELREAALKRRKTQPLGKPTCGSTFKNPPGNSAGRLIDELGLKGHQVGKAFISEKHANFIETKPGAKAQDVLDLIRFIQKMVYDKHQIELKTEVKLMGDFSEEV